MATQLLTIPMFPLNLVILPGEVKPLHIFEERYKQLIHDCLQNSANFGIPYINNNSVSEFGTEVRITKVVKVYDNGEMDIMIEGLRPFKMVEYSSVLSPKLYGAGMIRYEDLAMYPPTAGLQELIKDYVWMSQQKSIPIDAFDTANIYTVARLLDLTNPEKYDLVKAPLLLDKEELLKQKTRLFIHLIRTEQDLQSKFILN
ncbi:MAG: LON peptidase substrate-binding domain-containing protein [Bacteroidetes bacterium]|nr:LON peptidase substrate-binding domain-containing protein [Bacteroidota bacterium]